MWGAHYPVLPIQGVTKSDCDRPNSKLERQRLEIQATNHMNKE